MRKLLILLILLITAVVSVYAFYMGRILFLPDWYSSESTSTSDQATESLSTAEVPLVEYTTAPTSTGDPQSQSADSKAPKTLKNMEQQWDEEDGLVLSEMMLSTLISNTCHQSVPPGEKDYLKAIRSEITPEAVTLEMIFDNQQIPWKMLPKALRKLKNFLILMNGEDKTELYLKIVAVPYISDKQLKFDSNATVTLGKVVYPLADLLRLPLLQQYYNKLSIGSKIPYKQIELGNGQMLLRH